MKKNKFTIEEVKGQGEVLFKNGEQTFCPYQQPIPTQGIGGVSLMRMPCSTNCPLAEITQNPEGKMTYWVSCGNDVVHYKLEQVEAQNQSDLLLS